MGKRIAMKTRIEKQVPLAPDLTPVTKAFAPGKPVKRLAVTPKKLKKYAFSNRPKAEPNPEEKVYKNDPTSR